MTTGTTRGVSGVKSNRATGTSDTKLSKPRYFIIEYQQDVNMYNNNKEQLVTCQAFYCGSKAKALCIANDINHSGEINLIETTLCLPSCRDTLICKTLI